MAKAKRKKKRNYALLILSLTIFGLIASYGGYWFVSSLLLRQNITDWITGQRMEGWQTSTSGVSITGFPLDLNVRLNDLAIRSPSGWGIVFPTVTAAVSPFWPYKLNVTLPQSYIVATPNTGWMSISGPEGTATLSLGRRSRLESVELQANNLTINTPRDSYRVQHVNFSGKYLGISLNRSSRPTLSFDVDVRGLGLPEKSGGMSRTITSIGVTGRVIGNIPGGPVDGALALWRDNSGRVELLRADLNWPPLRLSATGNLALDSQMQPVGTGSGKAQNLKQTFDRMVDSGLLSGSDVTMVKYALGLLNNQAQTQTGDMNLSLSIQDGQFYTGSAPLFKMPEMTWSDPVQAQTPPPAGPIVPATRPSTTPRPGDVPTGDSGPIVVAPQQRR